MKILLTLKEAAQFTNIGEQLLIKLCEEGEIPCIFKGKGKNAARLFRTKDLERYVDYLFSENFKQNNYFARF